MPTAAGFPPPTPDRMLFDLLSSYCLSKTHSPALFLLDHLTAGIIRGLQGFQRSDSTYSLQMPHSPSMIVSELVTPFDNP